LKHKEKNHEWPFQTFLSLIFFLKGIFAFLIYEEKGKTKREEVGPIFIKIETWVDKK